MESKAKLLQFAARQPFTVPTYPLAERVPCKLTMLDDKQRAALRSVGAITGRGKLRLPELQAAMKGCGYSPSDMESMSIPAMVRAINATPINAPAEPQAAKPAASPEVSRVAALYQQAQAEDLALNTDRKVWEHLREHHDPADLPPSFEAFRKLATRARGAGLLEAKRSPRTPKRATGKSVIRHDQR